MDQKEEYGVWEDSPSQWNNFGYFVLMGLLAVLIVPIGLIAWRYLQTKMTIYSLTSERLIKKSGVLNKQTDEIELYRIKDYSLDEPLVQRIFGLGSISLVTSDRSHPSVAIVGIKEADKVRNLFRAQVEIVRKNRGVREVDVE